MTAGMFFVLMAVIGVLMIFTASKASGKGKLILMSMGLPVLMVALFGIFTAII